MDKFEIFKDLLIKEAECNHFATYITIGQMRQLLYRVDQIAKGNAEAKNERSISPMGDAGKNKI